jgi:hypothetical protein
VGGLQLTGRENTGRLNVIMGFGAAVSTAFSDRKDAKRGLNFLSSNTDRCQALRQLNKVAHSAFTNAMETLADFVVDRLTDLAA